MRFFSLLIVFCGYFLRGTTGYAQQKPVVITASEGARGSVTLMAENTSPCPYTVVLTCELTNMRADVVLPFRKVLVPSKKRVVLARLTADPGMPYRYNYSYQYYLGNTLVPPPATAYAYGLPFEQGKEYRLIQGSNGAFSHANKYALDFQMPENSVVCAAREGIVAEIKQDSDTGCPTSACKSQGNYVVVFHEDGSYATYAHLRLNGSLVHLGQQVARGEAIGYSGNTGWSSAPHLHLDVAAPAEMERATLLIRFGFSGQTPTELQAGVSYKR